MPRSSKLNPIQSIGVDEAQKTKKIIEQHLVSSTSLNPDQVREVVDVVKTIFPDIANGLIGGLLDIQGGLSGAVDLVGCSGNACSEQHSDGGKSQCRTEACGTEACVGTHECSEQSCGTNQCGKDVFSCTKHNKSMSIDVSIYNSTTWQSIRKELDKILKDPTKANSFSFRAPLRK